MLCPDVVGLILEGEEEIVLVAVAAQIAPDAKNGVGGEDVLIWRHGDFVVIECPHIA